MNVNRYPLALLCTLLAGGGLFTGCDHVLTRDTEEAPAFVRATSPLITPEGLRVALLSPSEVMDPAINQADTYVVMEMASQQTLVVEGQPEMYMPEEEHHIEAGYTASGELVTSDYRLDPPGDPFTTLVDEPRIMRAVGDVGTLYDVNGQALPPPSDPGYTFTPQQVLNDEGLQVTDGLIVEEIPDDGPAASASFGRAAAGAALSDVRVTRRGDAFTVSAEMISGNGQPKVRQARTYKKRGSVYVLDEATTDTELEKGGRIALRGQTRLRMRSVRWQNNAGRDAERRGRKGRARNPSPSAAEAPPPLPPPPCDPEVDVCGGSGGGSSPDPCPPLTDAPSLVFQHGIMSNADAWLAGGNGVVLKNARCASRTGNVVRHSMANSGFNSHASQIAELQADVLANTTGQIVMVGHSQGGIISRRLAQSLQPQGSTPTRQVRGLVTMDTPNSGAVGADVIRSSGMRFSIEALRQLIGTPQGGGFVCLPGCAGKVVNLVAGTVGSAGLSWLNPAIWSVDALQDLKPGSASVTSMNQTYETFPRFAIRSAPSARWMFARLAGDVNGKRQGQDYVRNTSAIHAWLVVGTTMAAVWGVWPVFRCFGSIVIALNAADLLSFAIGGGFGRYDGIVTYASQTYPNTPGTYTPVTRALEQRPVSHVGVQSSEEASERLLEFFDSMGIARR